MNRRIVALLTLALLCLGSALTIFAQDDDGTCPAFVEAAIFTVGENCAGLGRDEVCYGYNRVDATFWQPQAEDFFASPADRAGVATVQTLRTAPLSLDSEQWGLALLRLQANLPETQPGQAMTFLLMGDAALENAVTAAPEGTPVTVTATASTGANLRSAPGTNANLVGSVAAGQSLALVGISAEGDWYEVALAAGGSAWVFADLVTPGGDVATLPVTDSDDPMVRYAPMQALFFNANFGEPECHEAPDALVVQSPGGVQVTLNINGLEVTLGSTAVFLMSALPDGTPVLVVVLIEGSLTAQFGTTIDVQLAGSEAAGVTLNSSGRVDAASQVVEIVEAREAVQAAASNACFVARLAADAGLLDLRLGRWRCEREFVFVPAVAGADDSAAASGEGALSGVGAGDACTVAPGSSVNLRGGPGTNYPLQGQLAAGEAVGVSGQVQGEDGYIWWQLSGDSWVRGDLVWAAGACGAVPVVEAPPAPPTSTEPSPAGGGGTSGDAVTTIQGMWQMTPGLGSCSVTAGSTTVRFVTCTGMYASYDLAQAAAPSVFNVATIDGQPGPAFVQVSLNQFSPGVCWETAAVTLTPGPHAIVIAQTVGVEFDSGPRATTSVASCSYTAQ